MTILVAPFFELYQLRRNCISIRHANVLDTGCVLSLSITILEHRHHLTHLTIFTYTRSHVSCLYSLSPYLPPSPRLCVICGHGITRIWLGILITIERDNKIKYLAHFDRKLRLIATGKAIAIVFLQLRSLPRFAETISQQTKRIRSM